jgi:hypothetical protein
MVTSSLMYSNDKTLITFTLLSQSYYVILLLSYYMSIAVQYDINIINRYVHMVSNNVTKKYQLSSMYYQTYQRHS